MAYTLIIAGGFLIVVGAILLFVRIRPGPETNKPTIQTAVGTVAGPPGLIVIIVGVACLIWGVNRYGNAIVPNSSVPPSSSAQSAKANPPTTPMSPPATSSAETTRPPASIAIRDLHTTNISYLHNVPGKMTGFKMGEEAVWILVIIPGDPKLYPQGACAVTGEESFKCGETQFGDAGGKGTFYARTIIVNAAQQSVLRQHYSSGLGSMPKVVAKSALVRYTVG